MEKYFAGIKTVEELRKRYKELLKKYHSDNENGSIEITQEIQTIRVKLKKKDTHNGFLSLYILHGKAVIPLFARASPFFPCK